MSVKNKIFKYIIKLLLSGLFILILIISEFTNPVLSNAKSNCKYATTTVNIRDRPDTKSNIVGYVYWNDRVKIIRKFNVEWYMIQYQGEVRYICAEYLRDKKVNYKSYHSPSNKTFKSYEDADCITNSSLLRQGKLKKEYHLDYESGVWMVENRYCVAVGSYYVKKVRVKIDMVLSHNGKEHVLKCITADVKSDRDTINKHRVHKDGSIAEFVVRTSSLSKNTRRTGDISYAGKQFKGKIVKIRVYEEE